MLTPDEGDHPTSASQECSAVRAAIIERLERRRDDAWRACGAPAYKLQTSHPRLSLYLRQQWEYDEALIEELLRRVPNMESAILERLAELFQQETQTEEQLRAASDNQAVRRYLQNVWRDPGLVKAANAEGMDLHDVAALLVNVRVSDDVA